MQSHTTRTYVLSPEDNPIVVRLTASVALHYPAWADMPFGFSINFTPAHLPILRTLCQALEKLVQGTAHKECLPLDLNNIEHLQSHRDKE